MRSGMLRIAEDVGRSSRRPQHFFALCKPRVVSLIVSIAITATTIAALLVCLVIAGLFAEVLLDTPLKWLISVFFSAAMFALVVGLTFFLREVHIGMRTVRIAVPHAVYALAARKQRASRTRAAPAGAPPLAH